MRERAAGGQPGNVNRVQILEDLDALLRAWTLSHRPQGDIAGFEAGRCGMTRSGFGKISLAVLG